MRREVRDHLRRELKLRELPVYKLAQRKELDVQFVKEYAAANGDRRKLLTLIAGQLPVAGESILAAHAAFLKNPDDVAPDVMDKARQALAAGLFAAGTAYQLGDKKLAAGIAEGWLLPYAQLGHAEQWRSPSRFEIARVSCSFLAKAEAWEKVDRAARVALPLASHQNSADAIRLLQIQSLMAQKKPAEALAVVEEIRDPSYVQSVKTLREQLTPPADSTRDPPASNPTESPP